MLTISLESTRFAAIQKELDQSTDPINDNANITYNVADRMHVQIRSLDQANYNAQNGRSMMKVAEGDASSTFEILRTLKEKVINATTETNKDIDRDAIQKEIDASVQQVDDNALLTFNGKFLGNGSHNTANSLNSKNGLYTEEYDATEILGSGGQKVNDALPDRDGKSLGIVDSDTVTISFVHGGQTYSVGLEQVEQRVEQQMEQQLKQLSKTFAAGSVNGQQGNDVIFEPNQNLGVDSPDAPVFTKDPWIEAVGVPSDSLDSF